MDSRFYLGQPVQVNAKGRGFYVKSDVRFEGGKVLEDDSRYYIRVKFPCGRPLLFRRDEIDPITESFNLGDYV